MSAFFTAQAAYDVTAKSYANAISVIVTTDPALSNTPNPVQDRQRDLEDMDRMVFTARDDDTYCGKPEGHASDDTHIAHCLEFEDSDTLIFQ